MSRWPSIIHRSLFVVLTAVFLPAAGRADDPLWGESPTTFGAGVVHPEVLFHWEDRATFMKGRDKVSGLEGHREEHLETAISIQWAPKPALNLKVAIPYVALRLREHGEVGLVNSTLSGMGDVEVTAKSRLSRRMGDGWKTVSSLTYGLKLPTASHDPRLDRGIYDPPSHRTGSGQWGVKLGYALAVERLHDTTFFSVHIARDVSGVDRLGTVWEADGAYGRWVERPDAPQSLGLFVAIGPHARWMAPDHGPDGRVPGTGYTKAGWQASFIATKDRALLRLGILVPTYRRVDGYQFVSGTEFRASGAILF